MPLLNPLVIFFVFTKALWTVKVVSLIEPSMKLAKRDDKNIIKEIRKLSSNNPEVINLLDELHVSEWDEARENIKRFFRAIWKEELKTSFKWQLSGALLIGLIGYMGVTFLLSAGSFILVTVVLPAILLGGLLLIREFRDFIFPIANSLWNMVATTLTTFSDSIVEIIERERLEEGYYEERPEYSVEMESE